MKLTIDRDALLSAARTVSAAVKPGSPTAALRLCRFAAASDGLTMTATDLDVWLSSAAPAAVQRPGVALLDPATLANILREHREGEVRVSRDPQGGPVVLSVGPARYQLKAEDAGDFPDAPDAPGGQPSAVNAGALCEAARATAGVAGETEDRKFATGAVQFAFGADGLTLVGTDGKAMHVAAAGGPPRSDSASLLTPRAVRILAGAVGVDPQAAAAVSADRATLRASAGGVTFTARLLEGRPAPWRNAIKNTGGSATADRARLLAAVRCALVGRPERDAIRLSFAAGAVTVRGNGKCGSSEVAVPVAGEVRDVEMSADGDYLAGFLAHAASEDVTLSLGDDRMLVVRAGDRLTGVFLRLAVPGFGAEQDDDMVKCGACGYLRADAARPCPVCKETRVAA